MNDTVIAMLLDDMKGEHQAIIQYLRHAYALGETAEAAEIEGIAREEMRHFHWLADAVVELGGDPTMERLPIDESLAPPKTQMLKDVDLEQQAIDQYRDHIERIDDPKIRRLLSRILHDELVHKGQFADFSEELASESEAAETHGEAGEQPSAEIASRLKEILNQGVRHEYSVVLQYLYHAFLTPDKEPAEEIEDIAINEMQHLGWLAEEMFEKGGDPRFEHGDLVLTDDIVTNLQADIDVEREVTEDYSEQLSELSEEDLQELVERIRDHEIHHAAVFQYLLEEAKEGATPPAKEPADKEEEPKGPKAPPAIGSLIDRH
jgi:bacterioferritin